MAQLNQIVAVVKGKKSQTEAAVTKLYQNLQKAAPFTGLSRRYRPKDEVNGEKFPDEHQKVQLNAKDMVKEAAIIWTDLIDTVGTQDLANCSAKADIKVGNTVVLAAVPVTHMLFLEKHLVDVRTFLSALPVLDSAVEWKYDANRGYYASAEKESIKTKKTTTPVVLYAHTAEHPAQVQLVSEDVAIGYWTSTDLSAAMPADQKKQLLQRVDTLLEAVKKAREEANSVKVTDVSYGKLLFDHILQDLKA